MATRTDHEHMLHSASGAKPVCRIMRSQDGKKRHLRFDTPESVINVPNLKELKAAMEFYGRSPFLRESLPSVPMRRYYAEKIRPALRWYCNHFGVPVPSWLKGTPGVDDDYTPEDIEALYGPEPLDVVEFVRRDAPKVPDAGGEAR